MNIRVGGCMSLEEYSRIKDPFEEVKYALEHVEIPQYTLYDDFGNESILSDMVKTTYKATKGTVKTGIKGVKMANKGWANIKNKWAQIKPVLIKMLKDFGMALQNMWHKFLEYDKKYKELGQKINNIIQFSVNQMQNMPSVTFYYHMFNAQLLKGVIDLVANWSEFVKIVSEGYNGKSSGVFKGREIPSPDKVAEAIKRNDLIKVREFVADFSSGIGRLNQYGELTIAVIIDHLFKWKVTKNLPSEVREKANKNQISLSEYIKHAILGPVVQKAYSNENKQEFVRDMTGGNGSYLRLVASILNNNILEDALKQGGVSTKKGTDALVKMMESFMKEAEVVEKLEADKEARREKEAEAAEANAQLKEQAMNNSDDVKQETFEKTQNFGDAATFQDSMKKNKPGETVNEVDEQSISELAELYCKNYVIFVTKLSNTYANFVRGILSATYEIISEAGGIITAIESSANRVK